MPWSDSDDDHFDHVGTTVLLGVPDGQVDNVNDIRDAAVSRIGGHPAFLPSREPPFDSSFCKICTDPMLLLLQIWCPFEDSPMDRALYVWGCPKALCQRKVGSIRAWRGLRFNEKYAAKLEKKRQRVKLQVPPTSAKNETNSAPKPNPFSISTSNANNVTSNPFALGNQIFGAASNPLPAEIPSVEQQEDHISEDDEEEEDSTDESSSDESLIIALTSTSLDESPWKSAPAYIPLYLDTVSEYIPSQPKPKLPANVQVPDPDSQDKNDPTWSAEAYENSLQTDSIFDRFANRVAFDSRQCLRYDLKGSPLPFAKDDIYNRIFPSPASDGVSKAAFKVSQSSKPTLSSSIIPSCPICRSARVFECQLMPNLITTLKKDNDPHQKEEKGQSDEERKKAVQLALKGGDDGMSWGTVMIFSCARDCCLAGDTPEKDKDLKDCWREEVALVQWDA